jgi:molybdopterin/thiamine biosynthesis adenylyltransferase
VSKPNRKHHSVSLRVDGKLWQRMHEFHLREGKREEALSYVWARCQRVSGGHVVLIPSDSPFFPLGADCYERSSGANVRLRPDVLNGMLVEFAQSDFNCLVNVHDHWFSERAEFSGVDDADDLLFDRYLRERFEPMMVRRPDLGRARAIFNLSIVLGTKACSARLTDVRAMLPFARATKVSLLGDHWSRAKLTGAMPSAGAGAEWLARHEAFLSAAAQSELQSLHVAIIGCGGLGSILAESLVRCGVGELTLIDGDRLEASNLNRWQGAGPGDVGRFKAALLAERLKVMVPSCSVRHVSRPLDDVRSTVAMSAADIVVGGLDNDEARYVLNHFAVQHMQPYFDLGVAITTTPATEFAGRYFAVVPGVTGCVECKSYKLLDRDTVVRGFSHPATTEARRAAGYVIDRPEMSAPSAYVLNQRTAALGLQELLNFVAGWRPTATVAREQWTAGTFQRADRSNYAEAADPECPVCSLRLGRGWSLPLPRRPRSDRRGGQSRHLAGFAV